MRQVLPQPTPETEDFWAGCRAGELRLNRCTACGKAHFPPRIACPHCGSRDVKSSRASGEGRLYSYVINQRPGPGMGDAPHSIAVVELDEGPRMMTNIVNCPQTPEALQLDMRVRVVFERQTDQISLPLFEPIR